ncbi:MAG: alkaline phosphatase family protein, partial [Rhizobium sp.]
MTCLSRRAALFAGSALALISICSAAGAADTAPAGNTATPIRHLVVVFQENVSFDHYFATYPKAANVAGEPEFKAADNTPADINTLAGAGLLDSNPNKTNAANGVEIGARQLQAG